MSRPTPITRRTALRGLGTALALPWLEAMAPVGRAAAASRANPPRRMAFLYVPNGAHMPAWTPAEEGPGFTLPPTLEPLAPFRDELLVLTGLTQENANAKGDGAGDHARALSCFLTGVHPRKTDGANIRAGISVDQVAARQVGRETRLPSLELGCDPSAQAGNCDSGYSCAYSSNIAWASASIAAGQGGRPPRGVRPPSSPRGDAGERSARQAQRRRSVLDFVGEDARRLRGRIGHRDALKLDEYFTGVRELERRVELATLPPVAVPEGGARPAAVPEDYREHLRLMADMIALAFRADITRVATFVLANEGSGRAYNAIGVPEGHHDLSHHGGDPEKQRKLAAINAFHVEQLAYLLDRLKAAEEGDGSVLDNAMIVYGSGIGDGDRHNHDELPVLLAGCGGGSIATGRHLRHPRGTPLNNLFVAMLDRMGCPAETLGDATGPLPGLEI